MEAPPVLQNDHSFHYQSHHYCNSNNNANNYYLPGVPKYSMMPIPPPLSSIPPEQQASYYPEHVPPPMVLPTTHLYHRQHHQYHNPTHHHHAHLPPPPPPPYYGWYDEENNIDSRQQQYHYHQQRYQQQYPTVRLFHDMTNNTNNDYASTTRPCSTFTHPSQETLSSIPVTNQHNFIKRRRLMDPIAASSAHLPDSPQYEQRQMEQHHEQHQMEQHQQHKPLRRRLFDDDGDENYHKISVPVHEQVDSTKEEDDEDEESFKHLSSIRTTLDYDYGIEVQQKNKKEKSQYHQNQQADDKDKEMEQTDTAPALTAPTTLSGSLRTSVTATPTPLNKTTAEIKSTKKKKSTRTRLSDRELYTHFFHFYHAPKGVSMQRYCAMHMNKKETLPLEQFRQLWNKVNIQQYKKQRQLDVINWDDARIVSNIEAFFDERQQIAQKGRKHGDQSFLTPMEEALSVEIICEIGRKTPTVAATVTPSSSIIERKKDGDDDSMTTTSSINSDSNTLMLMEAARNTMMVDEDVCYTFIASLLEKSILPESTVPWISKKVMDNLVARQMIDIITNNDHNNHRKNPNVASTTRTIVKGEENQPTEKRRTNNPITDHQYHQQSQSQPLPYSAAKDEESSERKTSPVSFATENITTAITAPAVTLEACCQLLYEISDAWTWQHLSDIPPQDIYKMNNMIESARHGIPISF